MKVLSIIRVNIYIDLQTNSTEMMKQNGKIDKGH